MQYNDQYSSQITEEEKFKNYSELKSGKVLKRSAEKQKQRRTFSGEENQLYYFATRTHDSSMCFHDEITGL